MGGQRRLRNRWINQAPPRVLFGLRGGWRHRRPASTPLSGAPSIATRRAPTPCWRWRKLTGRPIGHPGRERGPAAMVMAGDENRDRDENQGGEQTAPPPAVLPSQLLFEPIETPADVVFPFTSSGACFFRHKPRAPQPVVSPPATTSIACHDSPWGPATHDQKARTLRCDTSCTLIFLKSKTEPRVFG